MKNPNRTNVGFRRILRFSENGAFTLVELIVVITILAILATVGFLSLSGYSDDARTATVKANVRMVYSAILTESTTTGNSPRYYVDHGTGAALSGAFVFVDGKQVALTGGNVGEAPADSNYTAGNPRWDRLRMNGDKFRLSFGLADRTDDGRGTPVSGSCAFAKSPEAGTSPSAGGPPYAFGGLGTLGDEASAAYSTGELAVGAVDVLKVGANGRRRNSPIFQVAGVVSGSKVAVVTGNYAGGTAGGLIRNPDAQSASHSLVDGLRSSAPIPETCKAAKAASPNAADGTYWIDPDGTGPNAPFPAYCDMTVDGGGWTLISNRKANSLNVESCGANIAEFFTNGCGTPFAISASDSYAMTGTARASIDKREQLVLQYLDGVADTGNAYVLHFSSNLELFPNNPTDLLDIPVTSVCDYWNGNCDTTDVVWRYIGDYWYGNSMCSSAKDPGQPYRGNYGVCHNGNASGYASSTAFGNRWGYEETKLWLHPNLAASYQERIFVR